MTDRSRPVWRRSVAVVAVLVFYAGGLAGQEAMTGALAVGAPVES